MYLSRAALNSRIGNSGSLEIKRLNSGRKLGDNSRKSHEEKVLIGVLSKLDTHRNVAAEFNTTRSNVAMIGRGMTGVGTLNPRLKEDIDKALPTKVEQVSTKALDTLMSALGVVSDKVGNVSKATDASVVARNMATIYERMQPRQISPDGGNRVAIIINAPKQKSESDFESFEVIT